MSALPGLGMTRHVKRKANLAAVFVRHGFGHLLAELGWTGRPDPDEPKPDMSHVRAVNLRDALTDAGAYVFHFTPTRKDTYQVVLKGQYKSQKFSPSMRVPDTRK